MPEKLPDINLLPKYERQGASNTIIFLVLIILILLSYILFAIFYFQSKSKLETKEVKYTELSEQEQELQADLDYLQSDGDSLAEAASFAKYYNIPTSILIEELNRLLPERGYLSNYSYASQEVEITTQFETLDKVAIYTGKLTLSDLLIDTKLDSVTTFYLKEGEEVGTDFSMIPRYESIYSLKIHKDNLKGAPKEDE